MQEKIQKQKRFKRAHLKYFPSQGVSPTKMAAHDIFQNKSRVRTTQGSFPIGMAMKGKYKGKITNTFVQNIPETVFGRSYKEQQQEEDRLVRVWQGERLTGTEDFIFGFALYILPSEELRVYFRGNRYIFKKVYPRLNTSFISIVYSSRENAMNAFNNDKIKWMQQLSPTVPDSG